MQREVHEPETEYVVEMLVDGLDGEEMWFPVRANITDHDEARGRRSSIRAKAPTGTKLRIVRWVSKAYVVESDEKEEEGRRYTHEASDLVGADLTADGEGEQT